MSLAQEKNAEALQLLVAETRRRLGEIYLGGGEKASGLPVNG
jgi:hypothetical protein